ncbi:MAG TPA: VOC family protein [Acidimicrobiales bacterium]|nr:VOC family protein [Acidimicrobiales bacterium]HTW06434.1 VOC family protein [Acidimicrobiales bacterium]
MKVLRVVPNMSSERFEASRDFYMGLFDMVVSVELGSWYLQLMAPEDRSLNVGFLQPGHEFFGGRPAPPGGYSLVLTVQVDDVDEAYARAQRRGARILLDIRDEDYGQRHFLVVDPNGLVLNVMSAI